MVCMSPKNKHHVKIRILILKPGIVVILALIKLRQKDCHDFAVRLGCIVGLHLATPPNKKRKIYY